MKTFQQFLEAGGWEPFANLPPMKSRVSERSWRLYEEFKRARTPDRLGVLADSLEEEGNPLGTALNQAINGQHESLKALHKEWYLANASGPQLLEPKAKERFSNYADKDYDWMVKSGKGLNLASRRLLALLDHLLIEK